MEGIKMMQVLTYKQIVKAISEAKTEEELEKAMWDIDRSFEHEKITWNDHETLYAIASRLYRA